MEHYHYERLSPQDGDFLAWETPALPMHGSGVMIFEAGPLRTEAGGVDFDAIKRAWSGVLHLVPRYRQKLVWEEEGHAVWVDDARFNVDYHMRHIALPRPGADAQLKRLAADIMERPLDRARPLWETWVVEGLERDRFAMVAKTHHCMVDGASGMALMERLFATTPEYEIREAPRFMPRPMPTRQELSRDALRRRLELPGRAVGALQDLAEGGDLAGELGTRFRAMADMARTKLFPVSHTPINGPIGPHRVFDWLELPLEDLKQARRALGCSINDLVLAVVTGAVRELMSARQLRPADLEFRVSTPVNVRRKDDEERLGNQVSSWIVRLPLELDDPLEQARAIHTETQALKESNQASAVETVNALQEWFPIDKQALSKGTQNMLVTNVPGPPFPLYLLGSKLESLFAQAPLIENIGLAISVLSYNGRVGWGFNADADRLPDLADFVRSVERSFEALVKRGMAA